MMPAPELNEILSSDISSVITMEPADPKVNRQHGKNQANNADLDAAELSVSSTQVDYTNDERSKSPFK